MKFRSFTNKNTTPADTPITRDETDTSLSLSTHFNPQERKTWFPLVHFSTHEQVLFAKRLSFLAKAGVTSIESMTIIRNQTKSREKRRIFDAIISDISAGQFLSTSLHRYGNLFGEFTITIIRVGEHTGRLSENLMYLAQELSKRHALKRKIQNALVYPMFITLATLGVTGLLVVFIFPKIMPIFTSLDITLPLTTRILLAVSDYLKTWGLLTILGCILACCVFFVFRALFLPFRTFTDKLILSLSIVGHIARAYNCANFCRTCGLSIDAGIQIVEALNITAQATKNTVYKNACLAIAGGSVKGEKISASMVEYPALFPDMLVHMVHIGETTGNLSETLSYLSDLYETEVEESTKNLSSTIEPMLLLTMGILVGIIAVSVISPIYEVTRHISNIQ